MRPSHWSGAALNARVAGEAFTELAFMSADAIGRPPTSSATAPNTGSSAAMPGYGVAPFMVSVATAIANRPPIWSAVDERASRVVELRFFGGLSVEEAAEVLEVSEETVTRDWRLAKMWLFRELAGTKRIANPAIRK